MSWFAGIVVNHRELSYQAIHSDILALYVGTQSDISAVFTVKRSDTK